MDEDHRGRGYGPGKCGSRAAVSAGAAGQVPVPDAGPEFERLFRELFRPLVAAALSVPGVSLPEAEDAAQVTLAEVLRRWPELANPRAYAYKALITNLWKVRERQRRQHQIRERQVERGDFRPEAHDDPGLAAVEFKLWLDTLLASLPPAQRDAIEYCVVHELPQAEAAELLGKSGPALRQALMAGRRALERLLAADGITARPRDTAGAGSSSAETAGQREVR